MRRSTSGGAVRPVAALGARRGRSLPAVLLLLLLLLAAGVAAQPVRTRHNLALAGSGSTAGTETCVFCHTPQGSASTAAAPMWNRAVPAAFSFTTYDSLGTSSLVGRMAPVGSVSVACLSCHDGVTSPSAVMRKPGGDPFSATAPELLLEGDLAPDAAPSVALTIGTSLVDDHPVGLQYGGGGLRAGAPGGTTRDPDFRPAASAIINSTIVWWVDTEATPNGTRQRTDMILYTRGPGSGYAGQVEPEPFIECASCHDPHASSVNFLRVPNRDSGACMACHSK